MSVIKKDQTFPRQKRNERHQKVIAAVATALREDYGEFHSAVKNISRQTGAHPRAVRNWYEGRNVPGSVHLIMLAKASPTLLQFMLQEIGGADLWEASQAGAFGSRERSDTLLLGENYPDKSVSMNFSDPFLLPTKINSRQLWFLQQLNAGAWVTADDIAIKWSVSVRTACRDIRWLQQQDLIIFNGAKRNGRYSLRTQLT